MADKELADLLKKQISLTEWLQDIDVDYIDAFRKEDSSKRKTLGEIAEITGWPVEGNVTFEAVDVRSRSALFNDSRLALLLRVCFDWWYVNVSSRPLFELQSKGCK